jgi:uncharacterized protein
MRQIVRKSLIIVAVCLAIFGGCWILLRPYQLHWAAYDGNLERMRVLLGRGADPNREVFRMDVGYGPGRNPLAYAIEGRQPEAIRLLIAAGADPNHRTGMRLPLVNAFFDADMARALLEGGADPHALDLDGSPMMFVAANCDFILLLMEFGVDPGITDPWGNVGLGQAVHACRDRFPELVAAMIARGADLNTVTREGAGLLMFAARSKHPDLVQTLLDAGADLLRKDAQGRRAIDYAREREDEYRDEVIELLLEPQG